MDRISPERVDIGVRGEFEDVLVKVFPWTLLMCIDRTWTLHPFSHSLKRNPRGLIKVWEGILESSRFTTKWGI